MRIRKKGVKSEQWVARAQRSQDRSPDWEGRITPRLSSTPGSPRTTEQGECRAQASTCRVREDERTGPCLPPSRIESDGGRNPSARRNARGQCRIAEKDRRT